VEQADLRATLDTHVRRFNAAVRSGDFAPMLAGFTEDAEMVFVGVPVGPFVGRQAIAEAYAAEPPDDEIRLLGAPLVAAETVESDYAWAAQGGRAGRMTLTVHDGGICRLVVSFE
jgi:steroid Delta-isomerase